MSKRRITQPQFNGLRAPIAVAVAVEVEEIAAAAVAMEEAAVVAIDFCGAKPIAQLRPA